MKGKVVMAQNVHYLEAYSSPSLHFTPWYCLSMPTTKVFFRLLIIVSIAQCNKFQNETAGLEKDLEFHEVNASDVEDHL